MTPAPVPLGVCW